MYTQHSIYVWIAHPRWTPTSCPSNSAIAESQKQFLVMMGRFVNPKCPDLLIITFTLNPFFT